MKYIVFNTETEMAEANGLWLLARYEAGDRDKCLGVAVDPQVTSAHDWGREMKTGKIACTIPDAYAEEFKGSVGVEMELTEDDFPVIETEV